MDTEHPLAPAFEIRRAVVHGGMALRIALAPLWLGGLLASLTLDVPSGLQWTMPQLPEGEVDLEPNLVALMAGVMVVAMVVGLGVWMLLFALGAWVQTGFIRLHVAVLERGSDDLSPLFSGRDRFWPMAGYKLLSGVAVGAAAIAAAWPGALLFVIGFRSGGGTLQTAGLGLGLIAAVPAALYVWLGAYLGEHAVVLEGLGPVQAMRRSFRLAHGNRFTLLFFAGACLLIELTSLAGVLLCLLGVLLTVPLARAITGFARTEGFLLCTRGFAETSGWRLWQREAEDDFAQRRAGEMPDLTERARQQAAAQWERQRKVAQRGVGPAGIDGPAGPGRARPGPPRDDAGELPDSEDDFEIER
ncbi:MAG: hypothetical protein PVI30_13265 [Myxococcales bacterium]|jgi:hypothetical protein